MYTVGWNIKNNIAPLPGGDQNILGTLERYWQQLRKARDLPARADINPAQIDDVLPHTFILQRVAPGIGRMRVAGQKLHDILQMDARGMPVSALFLPEAREKVEKIIEMAFRKPAILSIPLTSPGGLLKPAVNGQMLLLPLRDDHGKIARLLGALVVSGDTGSRARRFDINPDLPMRNDIIAPHLAHEKRVPVASTQHARPALRLVVNNA